MTYLKDLIDRFGKALGMSTTPASAGSTAPAPDASQPAATTPDPAPEDHA